MEYGSLPQPQDLPLTGVPDNSGTTISRFLTGPIQKSFLPPARQRRLSSAHPQRYLLNVGQVLDLHLFLEEDAEDLIFPPAKCWRQVVFMDRLIVRNVLYRVAWQTRAFMEAYAMMGNFVRRILDKVMDLLHSP